jgi:TonB family protein
VLLLLGIIRVSSREPLFSGDGRAIDISLVDGPLIEQAVVAAVPAEEQEVLPQDAEQHELETKTVVLQPAKIIPKKTSTEKVTGKIQTTAANPAGSSLPASGQGQGGLGTDQGGEMTRPQIISAPKPEYPYAARRAGFEGRVVLNIIVGSDGTVRDASVQQTSGRDDCDESAIKTLRDAWIFKPALRDGTAIEVKEKVAVVYKLEESKF